MEEIDVHLPVVPQEQDISEITGADTETIVPQEKLTLENEVGTSTPLRYEDLTEHNYDAISSLSISQTPLEGRKAGNFQFLAELISSYPDLIWETDEEKQSMFHIAVLHRHASLFNLIYELGSMKDVITAYKDHMGNNMLHLVAKLPDQNRLNMVSGAALQMQRELVWFKVHTTLSKIDLHVFTIPLEIFSRFD
uniref:PGG domain-containing protein n=1 Tax=Populus trichocarpa TaxID=3694 RepID=B9GHF1_POPTR